MPGWQKAIPRLGRAESPPGCAVGTRMRGAGPDGAGTGGYKTKQTRDAGLAIALHVIAGSER